MLLPYRQLFGDKVWEFGLVGYGVVGMAVVIVFVELWGGNMIGMERFGRKVLVHRGVLQQGDVLEGRLELRQRSGSGE